MLREFGNRIVLCVLAAWFGTASQPVRSDEVAFLSAKPIWPKGRETEKNLFVGFRAVVQGPVAAPCRLRVTASTVYRARVNGQFLGYGPARGPLGWHRVDEWPLEAVLRPGDNVVAVEVAGYNCSSFYLLDQPSFLQAEVIVGDHVLASTGGSGEPFSAAILASRTQKVQRYSYQRPFSEIYRLTQDDERWKSDVSAAFATVETALMPPKTLLPRRVPYPTFVIQPVLREIAEGSFERFAGPRRLWKDRCLTAVGPGLMGFPESELSQIPSLELQYYRTASRHDRSRDCPACETSLLQKNQWRLFDLGRNSAGFIVARIECDEPTQLFFTFDEILSGGDVDFKRLETVNILSYRIEPGSYELQSFEPYSLRYLKLMVTAGECRVRQIGVRTYDNPDAGSARFHASDRGFNRIFEAARATFCHNSIDTFTDCPSRERGGWANDAYWTARTGFDLCGNTKVEKTYFEDFLLPKRYLYIPDGMLPMVYPSDQNDGLHIPNCALWFVMQLEEYLARSSDRQMVDALQPRIMNLFGYFHQFQNSDGLLERLPGWIFVEWSAANTFVQDVNYPTNMEYAGALAAAGRMYHDDALLNEAQKIRAAILAQSGRGDFFVDNAVRSNGSLELTKNTSEVCQYMAFYFGVASPETRPDLWRRLCGQFGPQRDATRVYPDVHKANAIIGNYVRMELLSRYGLQAKMLAEAKDYYLKMAELTGTLWEHDTTAASCDHGFASHAAHVLYRDALGVAAVDAHGRSVSLRFADIPLESCEGEIPVPDGRIQLWWRKEPQNLLYHVDVPNGYRVDIDNHSGRQLVESQPWKR